MCISAAALVMASAGAAAGGTVLSGAQAARMGKYQQGQAEADARAAEGDGRVMAGKIRKAGRSQLAEAQAAQIAGGVRIDDSGAAEIERRIVGDYEEDAVSEILSGRYRAAARRAEGQAAAMAGRNQRTNALMQATSIGVSGWRTAQRSSLYRAPWEPSAPIIRRT